MYFWIAFWFQKDGLRIFLLDKVDFSFQPENIVCVSKYSWNIKLIDFGLAKELKPGTIVKTMQGTPEFVGLYSY